MHIISEINSDEYKIMAFVISLGACLFKLNKDGLTPAMIAAAIHNRQVSNLLEQMRVHAPIQCVYTTADGGLEIWIGDAKSLGSEYVNKIGFHRVVCVVPTEETADALNIMYSHHQHHICVLEYVDPSAAATESSHSSGQKSFDRLLVHTK